MFVDILIALFLLYAIYNFILVYKFIYSKFLVPFFKTPIDLKSAGQWAVITGCTDGIGKAYTVELAKIGMDVVLISRSKEKLEDLANNLSNTYKIKTKIVVADFTNTKKFLPEIKEKIKDLDIGVLVNNVGMLNGYKMFLEEKYEVFNNIVEINIRSTVGMCLIVLPNMVKNKRGVIINTASLSAITATPYMTCYGASKNFVLKFSEDLNAEYKGHGITVQCVTPSFITTKLSRMSNTNWFLPSPEVYVKSAIKTVGVHVVTTGFFPHDLMVTGIRLAGLVIPSLGSWVSGFVVALVRKTCGD